MAGSLSSGRSGSPIRRIREKRSHVKASPLTIAAIAIVVAMIAFAVCSQQRDASILKQQFETERASALAAKEMDEAREYLPPAAKFEQLRGLGEPESYGMSGLMLLTIIGGLAVSYYQWFCKLDLHRCLWPGYLQRPPPAATLQNTAFLFAKEALGLCVSLAGGYTIVLCKTDGSWWCYVAVFLIIVLPIPFVAGGHASEFAHQSRLQQVLFWTANRLTLFHTLLFLAVPLMIKQKVLYHQIWQDPKTKAAVFLGPAPWPASILQLVLGSEQRMRGSVNCCEEFGYGWLGLDILFGVEQMFLNQIDYCPVSTDSIKQAVGFMHEHVSKGESVYVHCKMGKGRSATIMVAYLATHAEQFQHLPCIDVDSKGRQVSPRAEAANKYVVERRPQASKNCFGYPPLVRYMGSLKS